MKRFAAHYVFWPAYGFLKQMAVEVNDAGIVERLFAISSEVESVEWHPGVIAILKIKEIEEETGKLFSILSDSSSASVFDNHFSMKEEVENIFQLEEQRYAYLFYPFDFSVMQPVGETLHRLLR